MKDKCISYYELLGMIKEGNIPKKLYVKLPQVNYGVHYIAEYDYGNFSYYYQEETKEDNINYSDYLGDCFLESDMFEKCIQVLDKEEFEDIEEFKEYKFINTRDILELEMIINKINADYNYKINQLIKNQKKIIQMLNKEN